MHGRFLALALALAAVLAPAARADRVELTDGRVLDGRVVKEDESFLWVKTLPRTEKVRKADVASRAEGESDVDRYETLKGRIARDAKDVEAHWSLHQVLAPYDDKALETERKALLKKILKLNPDHPQARDANGEVVFQGQWVRKADLERHKAEAERKALLDEWRRKLQLTVDVHVTEHFLLVDQTGEKDLVGRGLTLEEGYQLLADLLGVEKLWEGRSTVITVEKYLDYARVVDIYQDTWKMADWKLQAAKDPQTGGVWEHRFGATQIRFPLDSEDGMWGAILHSVAHLACWSLCNDMPPTWLEEGLGAWVEIQVNGEQINACFGKADTKKGETKGAKVKKGAKAKGAEGLRESHGEWRERFVETLEAQEFPELRRFLTMQLGDYGPAEVGGALGLVSFMVHKDRSKFPKMFQAVRGRFALERPDAIFKDLYGYELVEDMDREWKGWCLADW